MIRVLSIFAVLAATLAMLVAGPAAAADSDLYGVWRNPKNSVHIEIRPCGESACGYVVWATPKAQAAALRGSGQSLVGQQLLRDFSQGKDTWHGRVFVPDMNRTFSGSAKVLDPLHLEAQGCLIGGFFCKRQTWTRVAEVQSAR
jgi:uncharacterized protein (DUF2147 family)